jgi:hypothetical protein
MKYGDMQASMVEESEYLKAQLESAQRDNNQLRKRIDMLAQELRDLWAVRDWLLDNGHEDLFEAAKVAILLEKANEAIK